jgi:pyruvate ferredoxin oxidoreductase delta subunit
MFGPLIINPNHAKGDKTGSWRVQLRPLYLHKDCIACKLCLVICPESCIQGKDKNSFMPDFTFCKGCGLCALVCPKKDIQMVKEGVEVEKK